jgi:hypothetical protein
LREAGRRPFGSEPDNDKAVAKFLILTTVMASPTKVGLSFAMLWRIDERVKMIWFPPRLPQLRQFNASR